MAEIREQLKEYLEEVFDEEIVEEYFQVCDELNIAGDSQDLRDKWALACIGQDHGPMDLWHALSFREARFWRELLVKP